MSLQNLFDLRNKLKKLSSDVSEQNNAVNEAKKAYKKEQSTKREVELVQGEKALKEIKAQHRKMQEQYKEEKDVVCQRLKASSKKADRHFASLHMFLNKEWTLKDELMKELAAALGKVDVSILEECTKEELTILQQHLEKKARLIDAIITYNTEKRKF